MDRRLRIGWSVVVFMLGPIVYVICGKPNGWPRTIIFLAMAGAAAWVPVAFFIAARREWRDPLPPSAAPRATRSIPVPWTTRLAWIVFQTSIVGLLAYAAHDMGQNPIPFIYFGVGLAIAATVMAHIAAYSIKDGLGQARRGLDRLLLPLHRSRGLARIVHDEIPSQRLPSSRRPRLR